MTVKWSSRITQHDAV